MLQDKSYNQYEKRKVRHVSISNAVDLLTNKRYEAGCVRRDYVRKIYDYYTITTDESNSNLEAKNIDVNYIREWEKMYDSCVGVKKAEDLVVCYLCGPEPRNDYDEFTAKGVLPQNIWAFELDAGTYRKALESFGNSAYPQPRIIKQNIEAFLKDTPKQFDIIYIDACGSIPSSKHALRCITSICKNQRLASPGIIISNFTEPDDNQIDDYLELVSLYSFCKKNSVYDMSFFDGQVYRAHKEDVKKNFHCYYGDFISSVLRDIPAIVVPLQRLSTSTYLKKLFGIGDVSKSNEADLRKTSKHAFASFIMVIESMKNKGLKNNKIEEFFKEFDGIESLINGLKILLEIDEIKDFDNSSLNCLKTMFEKNEVYQFWDKAHFNMIYDIIINQITYPYHNAIDKNIRFLYTAKEKRMYTDLTVYDECRYIYEWLPAVDQMYGAFQNKSWQYVFRFGMDGLIKQRSKYNNEFFYQGAVVSGKIEEFSQKVMKNREKIEG